MSRRRKRELDVFRLGVAQCFFWFRVPFEGQYRAKGVCIVPVL
jgi:hypothetical protein